jgi:hypothetical protein
MSIPESEMTTIIKSIIECDNYFMYFTRFNPQDSMRESKKILNIDESELFNMILNLFNEDRGKLLDKFLDYAEKLIRRDEIVDENCGPLTHEQIDKMYKAMIEKDKQNENMA